MYFIFRHSKKSNYKDKIGKYYHYTNKSPNYKKVKLNSNVLIYLKEINSIIAIAKISKIVIKREKNQIHYFAYYKNFKKIKPILCDEEFLEKTKIKFYLDGKLPGIIPLNKKTFEKILKLINLNVLNNGRRKQKLNNSI